MISNNKKIVVVNRTQDSNLTSRSKERFFGWLSILVLIAIICVVGYLLWKVIKVLGLFYLGIWFLLSFYIVLKKKKFAVKVGVTHFQYAKKFLEGFNVKDIDEVKAKLTLMFLKFISFLSCFIAGFFLLCFALDSDYQIFPVNLLGFAAFLLMTFKTLSHLGGVFTIAQKLDEEVKLPPFKKKLLSWVRLLVVNSYIACLFLILFRII